MRSPGESSRDRSGDRSRPRRWIKEDSKDAERFARGLAHFRPCSPLFTQVPRRGILGSSLSSGAARRRLQICHEAPENSIGDAPLEAPQRLLAGLALSDLLAVVGSAPGVRPGLAYGDHV